MISTPLAYPHEIPVWEIADSRRPCKVVGRAPEFRPGDRVAVHFLFRGHDRHGIYRQIELVWLTVRAKSELTYVGSLEADPVHSRALRAGDVVEFDPPQVSQLQRAPSAAGCSKPRLRSRVFRLTRRRLAMHGR